ncbi:hypothetical protein D9619_007505 [Psilocybe cf. subviscida]|uniref:intramembrane prenyl-peptidase Rce1 n=1 Tax=Psilocybe cf. subviscida TaxID=2480587 RepID=A0A8H5B268_9AGAR|nr:hypothetical protein D9619_007505 [Psilocybe cf. subviscida]
MQLLFAHPLLSTSSAHLVSLGLGSVYVGSIFVARKARLALATNDGTVKGTRDDPEIIKSRLVSVSMATLGCCAGVFGILWKQVGGTVRMSRRGRQDGHTGIHLLCFHPTRRRRNLDISLEAALVRLGFMPPALSITSILPHLVTPVLFLGPLFASGFLARQLPLMKHFSWKGFFSARLGNIYGLRNYIVAPITEEIVFRSCVIAVYHLSGASSRRMIFLAPLTFGLAHVHHAYEVWHRYGSNVHAAKIAVSSSVFQLAYTTLFGSIASYLFLRTGSILPPITAHIFCNMMGFPDISNEMRRFPKYKKLIIGAYVLGIAGFIYALPRWTETPNNLYWPRADDAQFRYAKY